MESKYDLNNKTTARNFLSNGSQFYSVRKFPVKRKIHINNGENTGNKRKNIEFKNVSTHISSNINHKIVPNRVQLEQQKKGLPIFTCRESLMNEIKKSDTLLLMGETGSGKTTQIPQFLLSAGYGKKGLIAVTQPRRVAAITLAKRVSQELGCNLGETVGYTVRFEDCTSNQTQIRFMTDGYLLREALGDRLLKNYSVIMLDEAHERTVNTDILFGIVKEAQRQRSLRKLLPLKVIITSATMDVDNFSEYFKVQARYLEGRTHPVRIFQTKDPQPDYLHSVLVTLFEIHRNMPSSHDVLIFLTGQEEIEAMAMQIRQIAKHNSSFMPGVRVFPLYAQLPQHKQLECFLSVQSNARKIVLATNIAETSITIPGIRVVIDCGFVKQRIYCPGSGLDVLRAVRISQAQAWQRCGRAGRDAPGCCYRTYTQGEMASFEKMPNPEILRSNICATMLQLLALGIDYQKFDFLDKPPTEAIDSASRKLELLCAVTSVNKPQLTEIGRQMAQYPLDPQYSKILLSAPQFDCMQEMLSLVAMLSSENVFIYTTEKRELSAIAHSKFHSKHGDHLSLLNVFNAFQKAEKQKIWCHENFLNHRNLLYAQEVRKQLLEITQHLGLPINTCDGNYDQVRKCLLMGLFDNIATLQRDNQYLTATGRQRASIHPSSIFCGKYKPDCVIFTEIVLTERNFLRQLTEIDPEWLPEVVPKLSHLYRKIRFHK